MLERDCIQARGFRNLYDENGEKTGFQIRVRLVYYRGIWLSQLRPGKVIIDGEEILPKDIIWEVGGQRYTVNEIKGAGNAHWDVTNPAIVYVKKKGGLKEGYHTVKIEYRFSSSYMPPAIDTLISETMTGDHTRRLLLVD